MAKISSDQTYVVVEKNDTLSQIALTYKAFISGETNNHRINTLVKVNKLTNKNYIVVGQKIYFKTTSSSSSAASSSKPTIKAFGVQSNTDNTFYVTWNWSKSNTEHYRVRWLYATGDGIAFVGSDSTTTEKQSIYTPPAYATKVRVKVLPISKKYTSNGSSVSYWTASWSTEEVYNLKDLPPEKPNTPTVTIDGYNLNASLDNIDIDANYIEFQVVKDNKTVVNTTRVAIKTKSASLTYKTAAGSSYKVRCRAIRVSNVSTQTATKSGKTTITVDKTFGVEGYWSDYSAEVKAPPIAPKEIKTLKAITETSIYVDWEGVKNVDSYDIEYSTQKRYFDSGSSEVKSVNIESVVTHAEITGLSPGEEYFFRLRSVSDNQKSSWCELKSIILGSKPIAPTTWSSTTTAIVGDPLNLYWVHNTEDGSSQTYAELEIYDDSLIDSRYRCNEDASVIGAGQYLKLVFRKKLTPSGDNTLKYFVEYKKETDADYTSVELTSASESCIIYAPEVTSYDIRVRELRTIKNSTEEDEKDKTSVFTIDTTDFVEGASLDWRVRTSGITKEYSDWSIQRTVDVNAPPTLELSVTDAEGNHVDILTQFPFYVKGIPGPESQRPLGYHVSVVANEFYETVDNVGNVKTVNEGESIYSTYFDDSSALSINTLLLELSANNIDLENNITYTVIATVSMNSGLNAEARKTFKVTWTEDQYEPNAEVGIVRDDWSAVIKPVCQEVKMVNYLVSNESDKYVRTDTILEEVWDTKVVTYKVDFSDGKYIVDRNTTLDDISGEIVNDAMTTTGEPVYVDETGLYFCLIDEPVGSIEAVTETGEQVHVGEDVDGKVVTYCVVEETTIIEDVLLSVYRREFDGTFTEIVKNLENTGQIFATDPHPALDYARYRIVATSKTTGAVSYYDVPAQPVECNAVIIQWDEEWSEFEANSEDELVKPPWSGSLLKLPYNIDVSDKYDMDVSTIEYIGRKHPVSYYGTQLGSSSTWNAVIPKDDEETLYALRRLAIWPGDVYVREPSGSGYWANISVSFSQKHLELTIPVTLDIVRVEGGV